jgi:hypothetical protein
MGEWRYNSTILDPGNRWSAVSFTPQEITPGTHQIGGWLGPTAHLDAVQKNLTPTRN